MGNIKQKIMEIQKEIELKKEERNSFGNYNYWSCDTLLAKIKPIMFKKGIFLIFNDSIEMIGSRYYVKSIAVPVDYEEEVTAISASGFHVTGVGYAREEEERSKFDAPQLTGSATSYARKRAIESLFALSSERDSDHTNDNVDHTQNTKTDTKTDTKTSNEYGVCMICGEKTVSPKSMAYYRKMSLPPACYVCSKGSDSERAKKTTIQSDFI